MGLFFDDAFWDEQAQWPIGGLPYGMAAFGEVRATAARCRPGDADGWYREWEATAARVFAAAEAAAKRGHRVSAREAYLRVPTLCRTAYGVLFGEPVDPRLVAAFGLEIEALARGVALLDPPAEMVEIPFEGTTLPGVFYRPAADGAARPTLVCTNGYDATIATMHMLAVPALARGYNVLTFDGPGQGRALIRQGLRMRPDWEAVVSPVLDWVLARPEVDAQRVVLQGWSFGGYLAARAAASEPRLAACIADPGLNGLAEPMRAMLAKMLGPEAARRFPDLAPAELAPAERVIGENPALRWAVIQRGLWVHGAASVIDYLRMSMDYTLDGRVGDIRCPTCVTSAEGDAKSGSAQTLYDALRCPRTLIAFSNAEGAGDHCEWGARQLCDQRVFDWLDETLGRGPEAGHDGAPSRRSAVR